MKFEINSMMSAEEIHSQYAEMIKEENFVVMCESLAKQIMKEDKFKSVGKDNYNFILSIKCGLLTIEEMEEYEHFKSIYRKG